MKKNKWHGRYALCSRVFLFTLLVCFFETFTVYGQKINVSERAFFNTSPDYTQVKKELFELQKNFPLLRVSKAGPSDCGENLVEIILSRKKIFTVLDARKRGIPILFINNGIHPGEPDGTDACLRWLKAIKEDNNLLPENLVVVIVPVFNIDGALNRNSRSRANQNGPLEYGFRGNAKNLDLNRDFIKCDAKNTESLISLLRKWDPDVFLDTHVSNGADYQYTMTLISSQHNKLGGVCGKYLKDTFTPALFSRMKNKGVEMAPYVESKDETPDNGIVGFLESPRFSTGYCAQFQTFGFVSETHMWKPYHERVWATVDFIDVLANFCAEKGAEIISIRKKEREKLVSKTYFPYKWQLDTFQFDTFLFKGFEAERKTSSISGKDRLFYNRSKPFEKPIPFYDYYMFSDSIKVPDYYILPQAYDEIRKRLVNNGVVLHRLEKDSVIVGEVHRVKGFTTVNNPYEGHYLHRNIKTEISVEKSLFLKGDYIIPVRQKSIRFIIESLEPVTEDSYFAWNFFDGFLQQKEGFSDYIFEEAAEAILNSNPEIKAELEKEKAINKQLAEDHWQQLNFIYQRSEYKEKTHNRLPVMRTFKQP